MKAKIQNRGGRPRKREIRAGDRVPIGLRVSPAMRESLQESADRSGRSLSQEIELRLERSLDRQELVTEVLSLMYGPHAAGVLLLVAHALGTTSVMALIDGRKTLEEVIRHRDQLLFNFNNPTVAHSALDAACFLLQGLKEIWPSPVNQSGGPSEDAAAAARVILDDLNAPHLAKQLPHSPVGKICQLLGLETTPLPAGMQPRKSTARRRR